MTGHGIDDRLVDGRYARRAQLGRGGFGIVWRAHDTLLQRDVAMKEVRFPPILSPEEQAALREKVLREARAAARLSHPAVVTVYDVVEEDGRPFIVMELVNAPNLAEMVQRDGPVPEKLAAEIGLAVLGALTVAHAEGIIHRDVKPANVMVSATGRVQLADFGIASIIDDPKVTNSGQLAGSPSFMAPEQAENRPAGPATDLWGLGATLYFAVEGEAPFERDGAIPTLTSVLIDEPREIERAKGLAPLLRDLLRKPPGDRPTVEETR
ncbi:MAG TPA: serine/threonine-protein kinase, partial [Acidimicrobiales bacterium]|nr:serine/threonine-protein kinase [Acidimicrobiales bacterium]